MATRQVQMDEREMQNVGTAAVIALSVGFLFELGMAIWQLVRYRDIMAAASEIIFLVLVAGVFTFMLSRGDERVMLPSVGDADVEDLLTKDSRRSRSWSYAKNAVGLAVGFAVLSAIAYFGLRLDPVDLPGWSPDELLQNPALLAGLVIGDLLVTSLIFFAINYFWGEHEVRRYVRRVRELEN